jgi:putative sigma-54 modulation protein
MNDKVRQYAERKADKLQRFFGDLQRMELLSSFERGMYAVELTVEGDGVLLRSQERNDDLHAAINSVTDKVERQAVKYKTRVRDDRRKPQPDKFADLVAPSEADREEEPFVPVVARRKRYAMKPMSVEEAARQMELVSHPFYLFRNEESGEICALYRRHDGNYGLIEPDV